MTSRLRNQLSKIKSTTDNNYKDGGFISGIVDRVVGAVRWTVETARDIARDIINATGGEEGAVAGIVRALTDKGASDAEVGDILAQLGLLQKSDSDSSSLVADIIDIGTVGDTGFVNQIRPVKAGDPPSMRMAGTNQVQNLANVDWKKFVKNNTVFNTSQYSTPSTKIRPSQGPNIRIG